MCGIAGVYARRSAPDTARSLLTEMSRRIAHRGPNDAGVWEDSTSGIFLAHRRLSIIDLSPAGHQPMVDEASGNVIVFNGEIYNFQEIRKELEGRGHQFRSRSDTEVILLGYRQWGKEIIHKLRGMFAFALWDEREQSLWLVRDRLGKKPLYYWRSPDGQQFLFASEIKSLLAHAAIPRVPDPVATSSYVQLGYVIPPRTMFQDIRKLPAGHWMAVDADGKSHCERYWRIERIGDLRGHPAAFEHELWDRLNEAVRLRLISDVPVGAYLSGGMDSSTVVACMSRYLDRSIETFSTAHAVGPRSVKYNVDSRYAKRMAEHLDTKHRELVFEQQCDLIPTIDAVLRALDEPYANYSYLLTYGLARFMRANGVTVVLSGDGGDEVFGGYPFYRLEGIVSALRRVPKSFRTLLGVLSPAIAKGVEKSFVADQTPGAYFNWRRQLDPKYLMRPELHPAFLAGVASVLAEAPTENAVERLMYTDLSLWIAEESNTRMDRLNMAAAVESRAPFLDHELVAFGYRLPLRQKIRYGVTKRILRRTMRNVLPREVLTRPKWGFFAPVHYWMQDFLPGYVTSVLNREAVERVGLFRYEPIARALETKFDPYALWTMMTYQLWYDRYIAHEPTFP